MKNLFTYVCIFAILMHSCTSTENSPNSTNNYQSENLRLGPNSVKHADLLSLTVDNYDETAAYNNYQFILLPYFYDDFWSYGFVPSFMNQSTMTVPYNSSVYNATNLVDDYSRCYTDPEGQWGGYLPIPSEMANGTEYEMVIVNSDGNGDYSTDPAETWGGYLPIPSIHVSYINSNGEEVVDELQPNIEFFVMLMQQQNLFLID